MVTKLDRLFEYYDSIFFEEKVEITRGGLYGMHYDGLILDAYLSQSVLSVDYLSIEDYFEEVAKVTYHETATLFTQYSGEELNTKIAIIAAILTLVQNSSYKNEIKDSILAKSTAYLKRFGLEVEEKDNFINIKNEYKLFEGSYCNVLMFNEQFYKKQLKEEYRRETQWKTRLRYEYENMTKLVESEYVLKVHGYDEDSDSYLMEICDCDLFAYLDRNPLINDERYIEIITSIILGLKDVHDAGIIHRDLHLGNILLKGDKIILSDFGLSKDTMVNHSLKSTSTPKNSHFFIDPVGLISFDKLDKLSDIYSVGKIIDYISRNSELNSKLTYVINTATNRNKKNRYQSCEELLSDIYSTLNNISEEEKNKLIEENIVKNHMTPDVHEFILVLLNDGLVSQYIVRKQLFEFWKLLLQFDEIEQQAILNQINETYAEATGYGRFENYDLFANIMYNIIKHSNDIKLQESAYIVLKGCASIRYNAHDLLELINIDHPNLK